MKLKNIAVGDFIEAKLIHGGDDYYKVLEIGESYKVMGFSEDSDLSVIIAVPDSEDFADGLYVCPNYFRKPKSAMGKVTKRELLERCQDNTRSIERLELILKKNGIEPQLKQLTQSVFDGQDEQWRFAAVDSNGEVRLQMSHPILNKTNSIWICCGQPEKSVGMKYDASDWQNSLIERKSKELTGSDLCRAMLARGDKFVLCFVHEFGDDRAVEDEASVAINFVNKYGFQTDSNQYNNAVPINNQGEPLTASDVGL